MLKQTYSLTPLQKAMLFTSVTASRAGINIEQVVVRFPQVLDGERLREAWRRVIERHDILRTSFHWPGGSEPFQQVEDEAEMPWQVLDGKECSSEQGDLIWRTFLEEDRTRGFQMNQAPLMRGGLTEFNGRETLLLWTFHHILMDGRSISLVLEEVLSFYEELGRRERRERPAPKPFGEFVEWMNQLDEKPAARYWKELLSGFEPPQPLQLGKADALEAALPLPYGLCDHCMDEETTGQLEDFARQQDITLNTLVQAAWALVLSRYQDHPDIVFGAVRACRHWGGAAQKDRVGLFINNLPVRIRMDDDLPVSEWLQALRRQHVDIRPYEFSSGDKIREWAELSRETTLLESSVMFEQGSFTGNLHRALPQWSLARVEIHERAGLPLMLGATRDNGLRLELEYDTRRFSAVLAERMLGHVEQALIGLAQSPGKKLGELSILKPDEFQRLIYGWNQIPNDYRLDRCAHQFIEELAVKYPEACAVEAGDSSLTYIELNTRANRLAHRLRLMGIGSENRVGIGVERTPWMIVSILGIMKAGAAYVPIDPEYPAQRKEFIVRDAELSIVICDQASFESLPPANTRMLVIDREWEDIQNESGNNPEGLARPDGAAYMIYTSGSTGVPKGVVNLHRGLVNEIQNVSEIFGIGPSDRVLQFSTINFDSAIEEIFVSLMAGATLVLRTKEMLTTRQHFHHAVEELRITMLDLPTAFWSQWVNYMEQEGMKPPPSLRVVVVGGEKVAANVYEAWQHTTQGQVRWVNTYGPTETAIVSHYFVSPDTPERRVRLEDVPIGRVLANDCAYVLDSQKRPVPQGAVGELYIGGAGVAQGYWKRPELTGKAFSDDPFALSPGARMYRTGDRVRYREDGELEYVGRADFQIKLRGYRVEPGEIEQALGKHPNVAEAIVLAHKTDRNTLSLAAYVVSPKTSLTAAILREFLKERLPDYMIPQAFVFLDAMPLTPNGKVDRRALPKPAFAETGGKEIEAASNPMEEKLAAIFAKALRLERIGATGNFFEYGLDSLLTIELIEEAMKSGIELAPQTIFQYPSIRQLAGHLTASTPPGVIPTDKKEWSPLVSLNPKGNRPPIFLIHATPGDVMGYGNLVHHLGEDQPCYGFTSRGLFDVNLCHQTIEEMADYYNERLLEFKHQGPYILGGWCYGGTVAFEMARQLRESGKQVALVFLIECLASPPKGTWGMARYKLRRITSFLRMPLRGQAAYLKNKINHRLAPEFDRLEETIALTESPASLANRLAVYRENMKAFWRYRSSAYDGLLDVFLSNNPAFDSIYDSEGGWPLVAKRAQYHYFSGRHDSILKEPAVGPLAQRIRQLIDSL